MTESFLRWIVQLIAAGDVHPFYVCQKWRTKQREVLKLDRYECQLCKARGRYRRAVIVHHVNHLKHRPELALSIWFVDTDGQEKRNLVSVCDECHKREHPEQLRKKLTNDGFRTAERWD